MGKGLDTCPPNLYNKQKHMPPHAGRQVKAEKWGKTSMTEKENFQMMLRGEQPEWVPVVGAGDAPFSVMVEPINVTEHRRRGGGKDVWGVEYVATHETGDALIPKPNDFILDDITKWRDVIKAPSLEGIDWEKMAKTVMEEKHVDRSKSCVLFNMHMGYFQHLMAFMGFTEGLCAIVEEPEEVYALMDYVCTFFCKVSDSIIDYIQPDIVGLMDDTAAWANPFISVQQYRELFLPFHRRQAQWAIDRGIPIQMHNCGKSACFFDDLVDMGVRLWDPAQTCNDLVEVKKKFGNKLILVGGWDSQNYLGADVTDDDLRQSVREAIDRSAPGGGYIFSGGFLSAIGDQEAMRKGRVLREEAVRYGHEFYKK